MAQPIQYTPQFIKTDVGAIQDKLNARQGQYDTAFASTMGAEDQFGQFNVHQKDVDLKNKVIGGFKDRIKNLVDQYGGDYAAASKQLVKEIVNTKQDKFFGLAAERNKLAEEQRKKADILGINARVIQDVTKPDLMDAQGRYIQPDQLKSKVVDMGQYGKMYEDIIQDLKTRRNEGGLHAASGYPGLLESITTQGITPQNAPVVAKMLYEKAMTMDKDVSSNHQLAAELAQMADMYSKRAIQGSTRTYMGDPGYTKPTAKDTDTQTKAPNLFDKDVPKEREFESKNAIQFKKQRTGFESAAKGIDIERQRISNLQNEINNLNRVDKRNMSREQILRLDNANKELSASRSNLEKNRAQYKAAESTISGKYRIYNDIKDELGASKAFAAVAKAINNNDEVFPGGISFKANEETKGGLIKDFSDVEYSTTITDAKGNKSSSKTPLASVLNDKDVKISSIGIEPGKGVLNVDIIKDGHIERHSTTIASTKNAQLKAQYGEYQAIKDASSGKGGLGFSRIETDKDGKTKIVSMGGKDKEPNKSGKYVKTSLQPDGSIGSYVAEFKVINGKAYQVGNANLFTTYADDMMNQIGMTLGLGTKIKEEEVVK